jgi:hypothetical protein
MPGRSGDRVKASSPDAIGPDANALNSADECVSLTDRRGDKDQPTQHCPAPPATGQRAADVCREDFPYWFKRAFGATGPLRAALARRPRAPWNTQQRTQQ